jgi:hypothetical protein
MKRHCSGLSRSKLWLIETAPGVHWFGISSSEPMDLLAEADSGRGCAQTDTGAGPSPAQIGGSMGAAQVALTYLNTLGDTQA